MKVNDKIVNIALAIVAAGLLAVCIAGVVAGTK